ncbi:unnamed protein product [Symbiodinium sp. CCMP2592]|nr:unnamed protein product [Symbiodinium sp. CCMP2592]
MEQSVLEVLRRLTYGSPNPPVPAPFSQAVLNVFLTRTSPAARSFASSLVSAGNLTEVLLAGAVLLAETEQIRTVILETVAEIDPNYPARRVDAASQQIALASRIYKESLLHHFGFSESTFERDNAIAEFEARLVAIQDLGGELGGIVRDRLDLLAQMSNVQEKWLVFKDHASSPTAQELSSMSRALDALQEELSAALPMLAVKDDEPIPKFPWPAVIYVSVGVGLVLCVCCSIAVVQYRSRAKQDRNKNGVHGIADGV